MHATTFQTATCSLTRISPFKLWICTSGLPSTPLSGDLHGTEDTAEAYFSNDRLQLATGLAKQGLWSDYLRHVGAGIVAIKQYHQQQHVYENGHSRQFEDAALPGCSSGSMPSDRQPHTTASALMKPAE